MAHSQTAVSPAQDDIDWSLVEDFYPGVTAEVQKTKFRIFFAAERLFAHKGYNGTAVREIVENAGVTKPTLYYYFRNKEDLYVQLIDMALTTFSKVLERSLAYRGTRRERLINFFRETLRLFEAHVDLLRLVNLIVYSPRAALPAYNLGPKTEELHLALKEMLLTRPENGPTMTGEELETAMLLLLGLFRSIQVTLVVPEVGPPLSLDLLTGGIDVILNAASAHRPEATRK